MSRNIPFKSNNGSMPPVIVFPLPRKVFSTVVRRDNATKQFTPVRHDPIDRVIPSEDSLKHDRAHGMVS
eukprot:8512276-Karenia_brevis.AAC.1